MSHDPGWLIQVQPPRGRVRCPCPSHQAIVQRRSSHTGGASRPECLDDAHRWCREDKPLYTNVRMANSLRRFTGLCQENSAWSQALEHPCTAERIIFYNDLTNDTTWLTAAQDGFEMGLHGKRLSEQQTQTTSKTHDPDRHDNDRQTSSQKNHIRPKPTTKMTTMTTQQSSSSNKSKVDSQENHSNNERQTNQNNTQCSSDNHRRGRSGPLSPAPQRAGHVRGHAAVYLRCVVSSLLAPIACVFFSGVFLVRDCRFHVLRCGGSVFSPHGDFPLFLSSLASLLMVFRSRCPGAEAFSGDLRCGN